MNAERSEVEERLRRWIDQDIGPDTLMYVTSLRNDIKVVFAALDQARAERDTYLADLGNLSDQLDQARATLDWFDFIEDVEQTDQGDKPVTVEVTRTSEGWRKAQEAYYAAVKS